MKAINKWSLIVIVLILLLIRCNIATTNKKIYELLTESEIQKYIDDNDLNPIGIQTLYNRITLLIELTPNDQCYHEVYKVNGKITQGRIVSGSGNWSNHKPIMISGGTASGDYPFAVFYVFEDIYLSGNYSIKFTGDTGNYKEMEIKSSGNAIETKELGTIQEYEIYDSSGNKVY